MSEVKSLNTESFDELIQSDTLVMIDFWAEWCGPCKMLMPFVEELAAESDGSYVVAKVNVDDNSELCERYSILGVPTLLFYKKGEQLERIGGFRSKQQLAAIIEKLK